MRVYKNLTQLIGSTPLVNIDGNVGFESILGSKKSLANIFAKLECFNPLSSVKDRIALSMVEGAEQEGKLKAGGVIIEPTSGNTGIGLAYICAIKGYKLMLTMPESMSVERRKLLAHLGAEICLTPASAGMTGAIEKANSLNAEIAGSIILGQFSNPLNPKAHKLTTACEIWQDTDGKVDIFVAGVGTGGTITGVGEFLKEKDNNIKVFAVEPEASPFLSKQFKGAHKIQGIGAGFKPENYNPAVVDGIITVTDENAMLAAKLLAKKQGMVVGISSGASFYAGLLISALPENKGKNIVVLLPDGGERYISTTLFGE